MLFDSDDWSHLIHSLIGKTVDNKLTWQRVSESAEWGMSAVTRFSTSLAGDYRTSLGNTHFRMGAADGDGHAPFYLTVVRSDSEGDVTDTLRSDIWNFDTGYSEAAHALDRLYSLVHEKARARAGLAKAIISEIDSL